MSEIMKIFTDILNNKNTKDEKIIQIKACLWILIKYAIKDEVKL